ncbi:glycine-rich protein [Rathayibacter sp. Leaf296]|uniref:glycine-rich protein n=1 Tax=Rathayibacter sp. Leaf296 TaxID=1736327 RepID=UPI000703B0DA|nr:glycine-rich protein [Rathayibacter sp. Leaf296]KQQ07614.1 hypothetical protein ASF46_18435 [Rathayibacter sp. Leaf296]
MPGSAPPVRSSLRSRLATALAAVVVAAGLVAMPTAAPAASAAASSACGEAGVVNTAIAAGPDAVECRYVNRSADGIGGAPDTFTVPPNTHSLKVRVDGGRNGGLTTAKLWVTPGQVLQVNVGGVGEDARPNGVSIGKRALGGWNGGGTGGTDGFGCTLNPCGDGGNGATDVRTGDFGLSDRVLVAGGAGGDAYFMGVGGGENGQDGGQEVNSSVYGGKGGGGSQKAGGYGGGNASGGTFGGGGGGGDAKPFPGASANGGTGGGGGWYGGGGGSGRYYAPWLIYYQGSGGGGSGHAGAGTTEAVLTQGGGRDRANVVIRSIPDEYPTTVSVVSATNPSAVGDDLRFTVTVETADPARIPLGSGRAGVAYQIVDNGVPTMIVPNKLVTIDPALPGRGTAEIQITGADGALTSRAGDAIFYGTFSGRETDTATGTFRTRSNASAKQTQTIVRPPVPIIPVEQTITFSELPELRIDGPAVDPTATSSSGLPVSYLSNTPESCTVTPENRITPVGGGACVIVALQPGNERFLPATPVERSFEIAFLPLSIELDALASNTLGEETVTAGARSSAGVLVDIDTFDYDICEPVGTAQRDATGSVTRDIRLVGPGLCRVAAIYGDERYDFTWSNVQEFEVLPIRQSISFRLPQVAVPVGYYEDVLTYPSSTSGLPVAVTTTTPLVCAVRDEAFVRTVGAGTCELQFQQPGDERYLPAPTASGSFEVSKRAQTIDYFAPADVDPRAGSTYSPRSITSSGLSAVYGASGACTISEGIVTFTVVRGVCTITADQPGDANTLPAAQKSYGLTVTKGLQSITVTSTLPATAALDTRHVVSATADSGLPVSVSASGCTLSTDEQGRRIVVLTDAGRCGLAFNQAGDADHEAAPEEQRTITATRLPQAITVGSTPPARAFDGDTYRVEATGGGSTAPVVVSIVRGGDCTIEGSVVSFSGEGSCTVTIDQSGDARYADAPQIRQTITVGIPEGDLAFGGEAPVTGRVFGTYTPVIVAGPSTGEPVLSASGACSVRADGRTVQNDSTGTCRMSLDQPGDGDWPARRAERSYWVLKAEQTVRITSTPPASPVVGGTYTPTVAGGGSSEAPRILTGVLCSVKDGVVTFTTKGVCLVSAYQNGDAQYESSRPDNQEIEVGYAPGSVSFGSAAPTDAKVGGSSTPVIVAGPAAGRAVLFASGACSLGEGGVVSYDSAGTCTLTARQSRDDTYGSARADQTFEITKTAQTVAFTTRAPATAIPGDDHTPSATGGASGQPVVIGAAGACAIEDGVVTFSGSGTCTITADQAGDDRFQSAPQMSQTVAVALLPGTVAFGGDAPMGAQVGGSSTPAIMRGPSSADPVLTASGACSVASGVVSYDSAGTCTLTLDQAEDARHGAAPQVVRTFAIAKIAQTAVFTSTAPAAAVPGGTYTPTATGGPSGRPVVVAATGSCSIEDGVVTFVGSGTCTITADQAGDDRHEAAAQVSQSIAVDLAAGTVAFGGDAPVGARIGGSSTPVVIRGPSSADPVLAASGACSVAAGVVSYDSAGTCTLTLDQAGDARHGGAPQAVRTFEIGRVAQSLAFTSIAPAAVPGGAGYTPTISAGGSSAPVVLGTTTPEVCSITAGAVSFAKAGTCELIADQAGDATHEAAPRVTQSITVTAPAPIVRKAQKIAFTTKMPTSPERGVAYPVAATATSGLPVALSAKGGCVLSATGPGTATVRLTGLSNCVVTATQTGNAQWLAAPSAKQSLRMKLFTRADLRIAVAPAPGLAASAPLSAIVTVKNVGTRDAATTTTRVVVSGQVASAPGAVQTRGSVAGTTVLTWTARSVGTGASIAYPVTFSSRPKSTTFDAKVSTAASDPTPADNTVKRTLR